MINLQKAECLTILNSLTAEKCSCFPYLEKGQCRMRIIIIVKKITFMLCVVCEEFKAFFKLNSIQLSIRGLFTQKKLRIRTQTI